MKRILSLCVIALGILSCAKEEAKYGGIELASPDVRVQTDFTTANIIWNEVRKASGYAYRVDEGEYNFVEADMLQATVTDLIGGSHIAYVYAVGDGDYAFDSIVTEVAFEINPKLSSPNVSYEIGSDKSSVIFTWEALDQASGYVYQVDGQEAVSVGPDVLSVTLTGFNQTDLYVFNIYAKGQGVIEDSDKVSVNFQLIDLSYGYWFKRDDGTIIELEDREAEYVGLEVKSLDNFTFTLFLDGKEYGFMPLSGNGGVGYVNTPYATLPYANYKSETYDPMYYIEHSLGRLAPITDGGQPLWVNYTESLERHYVISVDLSKKYYDIALAGRNDGYILKQDFDLMIYGGDWVQAGKVKPSGRKPQEAEDGTAPGIVDASYTDFGMRLSSTNEDMREYIHNRELDGWTFNNVFEYPGYVRLSNTTTGEFGTLTTPALTTIAAGTDIVLSFDALRFAAVSNIPVRVLGSGYISSATVVVEGKGGEVAVNPEADSKSIVIIEQACPKHGNGDMKYWSTYKVHITGAGPDTQISWDTIDADPASKNTRICIDNIRIR